MLLRLRHADADYLSHRICTAKDTRDSLLAELGHRRTPWDEEGHIWHHPDAGSWRPDLREVVYHARLFSEVMHGATLLYNHLLIGLLGKKSPFEVDLDAWADLMDERAKDFASWDKRRFWEIARSRTHAWPPSDELCRSMVGLDFKIRPASIARPKSRS